MLLVPARATSSGSRSTAAASCRPRPTASASLPAAMTARCSRPTRSGKASSIATDAKRRWIDHVAVGPRRRGRLVGRQTGFRAGRQRRAAARSRCPPPSAGLAFAPKGFRLAIAHYNGVTLWFPNAQAAPEMLEWKGSHLAATFSPDGQFLVTAMQEPTLHGWRVVDRQAHAHVGLLRARALVRTGPRAANGSPPPAPSSSSCGRSRARTGPWASSRKCSRPSRCGRGRRLPSQAGGGRGRLCRRHCAAGADRRRRRSAGARSRAKRRSARSAGTPAGTLLAFGTEAGEAGMIDLA